MPKINVKTALPWHLIDQVRQRNSVVLTVANNVTPSKVADALSAIGASPIMSAEPLEAKEMVKIAHAITINLGTITGTQLKQIRILLDANAGRLPVVLDPVAVSGIKYRLNIAQSLLQDYYFTAIRGNAGEIAALTGIDWTSHGIDTGNGDIDPVFVAKQCARQYHCCVILTGKTDIITDGQHVYLNPRSTPYFVTNVGSGDMLSSIIAAYLGIVDDDAQACAVATTAFSIAGISASQQAHGLGSWQVNFLDELCKLTQQNVHTRL